MQTLDIASGLQVNRNAFWLLGLKDDFYTIQQIKETACNEDKIPIIVFFMHPSQGLALDEEAGHYMPDSRIGEHLIALKNMLSWKNMLSNGVYLVRGISSIFLFESLCKHCFFLENQ